MLVSRKRSSVIKTVDNKLTQNFGDYATYFKLYLKLWQQMSHMCRIANLNRLHMTLMYCKLALSSVWFCLLKPLGQFYSHKTRIAGTFTMNDDIFINISLYKYRVHKIFGITVFYHSMELTEDDKDKLINN